MGDSTNDDNSNTEPMVVDIKEEIESENSTDEDIYNHNSNFELFNANTESAENLKGAQEPIEERIKTVVLKEINTVLKEQREQVFEINERILQVLQWIQDLKTHTKFTLKYGNEAGTKHYLSQIATINVDSAARSNDMPSTAPYPIPAKYPSGSLKQPEAADFVDQCSNEVDKAVEGTSSQSNALKTNDEQLSEEQSTSEDNTYTSYRKCHLRLIIGNTSKYLPPDTREDNATHKWMVYVRSDRDNEDLSSYVKNVRFYLHESYKPNDVVDVNRPPYHLSRRGWGEFVIKVRLLFNDPINKPVNVVHSIKLDETHSGFQRLGAETVVSLELWKERNPTARTVDVFTIDSDSDSEVTDIEIEESATIQFVHNIHTDHDYFSRLC